MIGRLILGGLRGWLLGLVLGSLSTLVANATRRRKHGSGRDDQPAAGSSGTGAVPPI